MPVGHRSDLPEVTFCDRMLVAIRVRAQHGRMRWKTLLSPLNIAAMVTIAAIGATLVGLPPTQRLLAYGLLLAFALLLVLDEVLPVPPTPVRHFALLAMGAITLLLLWLFPRAGAVPILSVIMAAMMAGTWPSHWTALALLVGNTVAWWILLRAGAGNPLMSVVLLACFQLFAVLTVHYARTAEQARDRLALVNADLLATRALLADASRDAERLRVARELHDVAGHKLTALRLNLRALNAEGSASPPLRLAEQLSAELLDDIRGVVHALRDIDGLDIATALRALAAPLPRPALDLSIDPAVRITDAAAADTLLRCVQEALTNSARHSGAQNLQVTLMPGSNGLHLRMEDDGRLRGELREGHGLTGMRERIAEAGGHIVFSRSPTDALCIDVALPHA